MANELFSAAELSKILDAATSKKDLTALAKDKSSVLCEKIQQATAQIATVKTQAQDVSAAKKKDSSDLLGMAGKLFNLASSGVQTANTGIQLNNLVQEAIKAFTSSSQFATIIQSVLKNVLSNGFTDSSGHQQQLSSASQTSVNTILSAVTSFLKTAK